MKQWKRFFAAVTGCMALAACNGGPAPEAIEDEGVAEASDAIASPMMVIPSKAWLGNTVLSATDELLLGQGSEVGSSSRLVEVGNLGVGATLVGRGANVHANLTSVAPIEVGERARIDGTIESAGAIRLDRRVSVGGATRPSWDVSPRTFGWEVSWPSWEGSPITVPSGAYWSLVPGVFGPVTLGPDAAVLLRSGSYHLSSLETAPGSRLVIDDSAGPVIVHVRGTTLLGGEMSSARRGRGVLLVSVGPFVDVGGPLAGTIVAPSAEVRLAATFEPHVGQVFARKIMLDDGGRILLGGFDWGFFSPSLPGGGEDVPGGFPGEGPGLPGEGPGFPGESLGFPQKLPGEGPGFPGESPGFPQGYPGEQGSPGFPQESPGFPGEQERPGYPEESPGFPGEQESPGYPEESPGYPVTKKG